MTSIIPIKPFGKSLDMLINPVNVVDNSKNSVKPNSPPVVPAGTVLPIFTADAMVLDGISFSHSSKKILTPLGGVVYAKDNGMVLQSLDAAVFVRDMLDRANVSSAIGVQEYDSSLKEQVTSTFATYWFNRTKLWMGLWDLESVYGSDLDKHVTFIEVLSSMNALSVDDGMHRNCPEMRLIMNYIGDSGRMVEVPKLTPVDIPVGEYRVNPYMKLFLPQCVGRNAEYIQRKGYAGGEFFFLDARFLQHLKGTKNVGTMPVMLCGLDQFTNGEVNGIGAGTGFMSAGQARGVALGKKDFNKVYP